MHHIDLLCRVETEWEGSGQIGLGIFELGSGRALLAHMPPFLAHERDRLGDAAVLGRDIADDEAGMAVRHKLRRDAVSEAPLLADFLHQPSAEPATAAALI